MVYFEVMVTTNVYYFRQILASSDSYIINTLYVNQTCRLKLGKNGK